MTRCVGEVFLQHVDQVQSGFDCQYLIDFKLPRQAQVRMLAWRVDRRTEIVALMPADVVYLDSEQVSQAVRIKCRAESAL